jgi:hypothetical protein
MTNKSFNFLYISAIDVLIGTLGIFIILNFLNSRLAGVPPTEPQPIASAAKPGTTTTTTPTTPPKPTGQGWFRSMWRPSDHHVQQPQQPQQRPVQSGRPVSPQDTVVPKSTLGGGSQSSSSSSSVPVAVDLMKSTKGAVSFLIQQADRSKSSVEMMLRQGSRTWKPTRSSKYQNETWGYERRLTYYFQDAVQPGTYEVLVRVKRASRGDGAQRFALYGKVIPPGGRTQTFSFGSYSVNADDWVPAGTLTVSSSNLNYQSRLSTAAPAPEPSGNSNDGGLTDNSSTRPSTTTTPTSRPATRPTPKKGGGKWD